MPAKPAVPASQPATSSGKLTFSVAGESVTPTILFGWSVAESTGSAAASFRLWDNSAASGIQITSLISLNQGETNREWFGDEAIEVYTGAVYLQVVSGSVELVAWLG